MLVELQKKKARSNQYPAETGADYADDLALLANSSAQTESLLHIQELAARSVGLCVKSDKTKFLYLNQDGNIFPLHRKPLKLVS